MQKYASRIFALHWVSFFTARTSKIFLLIIKKCWAWNVRVGGSNQVRHLRMCLLCGGMAIGRFFTITYFGIPQYSPDSMSVVITLVSAVVTSQCTFITSKPTQPVISFCIAKGGLWMMIFLYSLVREYHYMKPDFTFMK